MRGKYSPLLFLFLVFLFTEGTARGYDLQLRPSADNSNTPSYPTKRMTDPGLITQQKDQSASQFLRQMLMPSNTVALERPIDSKTYIVGPGDQFVLNVWGSENNSVQLIVTPEGNLFVPQVGYLNVAGIPLAEVRNKIKEVASYYFSGTNFDISLVQPRVFQLHVVGEVKNPGVYSAAASERLSEVLQRAGGVLGKGSKRAIQIRRQNNKTLLADLFSFETFADINANPYVLDNDIIFVPLAARRVTFNGAINRPGSYELTRENTLESALRLARGPASLADAQQPIQVVRYQNETDPQVYSVPWDQKNDFSLQDNDIVTIPSLQDSQKMVRVRGAILGTEPNESVSSGNEEKAAALNFLPPSETERQVLLPYVEGTTAGDLIRNAGGPAPWADFQNAYIIRKTSSKEVALQSTDGQPHGAAPTSTSQKALYASRDPNPSPEGHRAQLDVEIQKVREIPFDAMNPDPKTDPPGSGESKSAGTEEEKPRTLNRYLPQKKVEKKSDEADPSENRQIIKVDLYKLVIQKDVSENIRIQAGDELVIPKIQDNVFVAGAVVRGGAYPYNPQFGPMSYIGMAGGLLPEAKKGQIKVMSHNGKAYSLKKAPSLEPGDTIYVPNKTFAKKDWLQMMFSLSAVGFSAANFAR